MGRKINLDDIARRQRAEVEHERLKAEAERIAAIEERSFKRAFSDAIERRLYGYSDDRPRPHPNNAGRKPVASRPERRLTKDVNGEGVCLGASKPGSGDSRQSGGLFEHTLGWIRCGFKKVGVLGHSPGRANRQPSPSWMKAARRRLSHIILICSAVTHTWSVIALQRLPVL